MRRAGGRQAAAKVLVALLVLSLVLPLVLFKCGDAGQPRVIVLWHSFTQGSREDQAIRQVLSVLAAEGRSSISMEIVALGDLFGLALAQAAQTGQFPDLLLAPAEWAPTLYYGGLLHSLPLEPEDDWLPAVQAALVRNEQLIALPAFCSTVGLGRSGALSAEPWPGSVAELDRQAQLATSRGAGGAFWPVGDLFYTIPWYLAAGGRLEREPAAGADPEWTALPEAPGEALEAWLAAVARLRSLAPQEPPDDLVAAWLADQIALAPLIPGEFLELRASGASFEVGPLPSGEAFLSTWALMLVRTAQAPADQAIEMLIRLRAGDDDGLLYLAVAVGFLPPRTDLFTSDLVQATGLQAYLEPATSALPMPSSRYAAEIWSIFETALSEFLGGAKANVVIGRLRDSITELGASGGN